MRNSIAILLHCFIHVFSFGISFILEIIKHDFGIHSQFDVYLQCTQYVVYLHFICLNYYLNSIRHHAATATSSAPCIVFNI